MYTYQDAFVRFTAIKLTHLTEHVKQKSLKTSKHQWSMTNKNIILQGDFLIFDVDDTKTRTECWSRTTPRKVKVTFEKTLTKDSYCLRLLDPTGKVKPLYYHLDKTVFCGTDWGDLNLTKSYMLCWKRRILYKFLTVFIGSEQNPKSTACVLLRTEWDRRDQKQWQRIINEKFGLNEIWSVRNPDVKDEEERVLLCLTEQMLALNSKVFSSSKVFPKCLWNCHVSLFTVVATYSEQTKALNIVCTGRSRPEDQRTYQLLTSKGKDIVTAINRVFGLSLIIPNHEGTESQQTSKNDETRPPPCTNRQFFPPTPTSDPNPLNPLDTFTDVNSNDPQLPKTPTPMRPLPLPPGPNLDSSDDDDPRRRLIFRRKASKPSFSISRSLRRSFSLGEKQFKSSRRRMKVMLREKVSLSGGYGSDTEDTYQMPIITHPTADRHTLFIHNRWYHQFKGEVDTQEEPEPPRQPSWDPRLSTDEEHYWTTEISFSLQEILEKKVPDPDTLKLAMKQKIRLKFLLYPSGLLGCGWQELGGHLGLTCQEIDMVEHFCFVHSNSPVDVLFHHWQFVHNKQRKQKLKDPDFVPVCPPCTKEQLILCLYEMGRLDIIESCNFQLPNTTVKL